MKRLIDLVRRYAGDAWGFAKFICCDVQEFVPVILIIASLIGAIAIIEFQQDGEAKEMDGSVVVVKVHGEAHEYLKYSRGITHLPNCKYCKGETK